MNIAVVHPYLDSRGGSQRYSLSIARGLHSHGVSATVFAYEFHPRRCYPEITKGLEVHAVATVVDGAPTAPSAHVPPFAGVLRSLLRLWRKPAIRSLAAVIGLDYIAASIRNYLAARKLSDLLYQHRSQFDLVFVHEEPLSVWAAGFLKAAVPRVSVYWFCYDTVEKWAFQWETAEARAGRLRKFVLRHTVFRFDHYMIRRFVDRIAVLDHPMYRRVKRMYHIVPLVRRGGVNLDEPQAMPDKRDDDRIVISCVSRFSRPRRIHDLFALFSRLPVDVRERVELRVHAPISEADYYDECMRRFSDVINHHNVHVFTEHFASDVELRAAYVACDILVYPNENQTWGHAVLEAMDNGAVVVVSDGAGVSEVVEELGGVVYTCGDVDELVAKVTALLLDAEAMTTIEKRQRAYIREHLTWERVCATYVRDFEAMLSAPQRAREESVPGDRTGTLRA